MYFRPKQLKKLYYQRLSIPIQELENKRPVKCLWISADHKDEQELTLYPPKSGTVEDLLQEARQAVTLSRPDATLRLLDIVSHKIVDQRPADTRLETLGGATSSKVFRVEEVPADQETVAEDEALVPVAHFQKEVYSTFGHPFFVKVREGERFEAVKEKLQRHLDVPDKEFERYRIAVVAMGRAKYLDDVEQDSVRLRDFASSTATGGGGQGNGGTNSRPYIGLEHMNKMSKRARYNYMEKAIKIYN